MLFYVFCISLEFYNDKYYYTKIILTKRGVLVTLETSVAFTRTSYS